MFFLLFFVLGFGETLLPMVLIFGIVGYLMSKAIGSSKTNQYTNAQSSSRRSTIRRRGYTDTKHTADQKARVNTYLMKRFRSGANSISMTAAGHSIVLTKKTEKYTSLDSLEVTCDGHYFNTMASFRDQYGGIYDSLFDSLLTMAQNDVAVKPGTIIDAEYVAKGDEFEEKKEAKKPAGNSAKESEQEPEAYRFREQINSLNDGIPDEEISNGLYETTGLLKQLGDLEKHFPSQKSKLTKLYRNYLPYLCGILKQYTKMQNVQTDANYQENVESLKKTISHINSAMRDRIIPSMSESDSINLQADMSTLDAMLRKDGYSDEGDIMASLRKKQGRVE